MTRSATDTQTNAGPFLLAMTLVLMIGTGHAMAYTASECIACHAQAGGTSRLRVSMAVFETSVHAAAADCTECHTHVTDADHMQMTGLARVDCGQCHAQPNPHGLAGADEPRPGCADCHTRHNIRAPDDPDGSVHVGNLTDTCGRCHPAQSGKGPLPARLATARVAFHGKGDMAGDYTMGHCIGCHQGAAAHGEPVLRVTDAACHVCHMDADGRSALWGPMHPPERLADRPLVYVLALLYPAFGLTLLAAGLLWVTRRWSRVPHGEEKQS